MYKKIDKCKLIIKERWCNSWLVSYPVSYTYNGGICLDGKVYEGYEVAQPTVPEGFQLVSIGIGLQLNARPPMVTSYLEPVSGSCKKVLKRDLKKLIENT